MVLHKCSKCSAEFNKMSNFKRHLNRKKSCEYDLYNILQIKKPIHANSKKIKLLNTSLQTEINKKDNNIENTKETIKSMSCSYCNKTFSSDSNLTRHIKTFCKVKKNQNNEIQQQKIQQEATHQKKIKLLLQEIEGQNKLIELHQQEKNNLTKIYIQENKKLINQHQQENNKSNYKISNLSTKITLLQNLLLTKNKTKKSLPKKIRMLVWNKYIGEKCGVGQCICCKSTEISQSAFHCGHVVSSCEGGDDSIENLRPICPECNLSMSTMNMNDFIKQYKLHDVKNQILSC
jgi:hypothetical protein